MSFLGDSSGFLLEQRNLEEDDDLGVIRQRLEDLNREEILAETFIVSVRTKEDLVSVVVSSSILCRTMLFSLAFQSLCPSSLATRGM